MVDHVRLGILLVAALAASAHAHGATELHERWTRDILVHLGVAATECGDLGMAAPQGAVCAQLAIDFDTLKRSLKRFFKHERRHVLARSPWWHDRERGWMVQQTLAGPTTLVLLFDPDRNVLMALRNQTCFERDLAQEGVHWNVGEDGVTEPVLVDKTSPRYPDEALIARSNGHVMLQVIIDREGQVSDACVVSCSRTRLGFEEAAIDSVKQWSYRPATKGGVPVPLLLVITVEFTLH